MHSSGLSRLNNMTDYLDRRVSKSAAWSRRLASFSAVLFLTAGLAHRFGFLETTGFIPVLGVVGGLAVLALLLAARAFFRFWNFGDSGGANLTVGVLIALLVLTPFALLVYRGLTYPMLHDISTDLDDPPALRFAENTRTPEMNRVTAYSAEKRKLQLDNYPLVTGRRYDLPFDRVSAAVAKVIDDRGWLIVSPRQAGQDSETTVEALAYTFILAFPADVAIRMTDEETSTYVDMRSSSRYGEHDFGDNSERIAAFLADLDAEIAALAGVAPVEPVDADPSEVDPDKPVSSE